MGVWGLENEKRGCLSVCGRKGLWKCLSWGKGGNVVELMMEEEEVC